MLNIYYGNESIDKEKFIFERIAERGGRTLVIVPDQFSAQTERNAFFYLGKKSLMDLVVLDFDRLGKKAINAAGVPVPPLIDKYGRHMLLTEILRKEDREDTLKTYKGMSRRRTFVAMMNSLISEMKRNEVTPEAISGALSRLDDSKYLKRKLTDIVHIYDAYEKAIEGKYLDSEDYITFYGDVIRDSELARGAQVWIYGFDTFTPKNLLVVSRLLQASESVNIVMDWEEEDGNPQDAAFLAGESRRELFALTGYVISRLDKTGRALGHQVNRIPVKEPVKDNIWTRGSSVTESVTLAKCSGPYSEAESAAAYITWLVRDRGYRYGDIAVICNDMTGLGAILERTLRRWQIPSFMDRKRNVLHHPAVRFIIALMDIAAEGYRPEQIMTMIKSGLMGFNNDEADALENYVHRFRIRGNRWKEEFTKRTEETSEDLEKLNLMRQMIISAAEGARESLGRRNSAGEKIRGLYKYLTEDLEIEKRLESIMDGQEEAGFMEAASETAQSWNVICAIFDQIVEVTGDKGISNRELKELLLSGLEEMEIGLVPVRSDSVIIGTLQRTRLSRNKVLLVTGANEDVLPMAGSEEGILSERELEELESMDLVIGKTDAIMRGEEALAVYRNLTAPEERLYMSFSKTNTAGEDTQASRIFRRLEEFLLDRYEISGVKPDIRGDVDSGSIMEAVTTPAGTLEHLAGALREYRDSGDLDPDWYQIINWYDERKEEGFLRMKDGLSFTNRLKRLGDEFAGALYMGDAEAMSVSISRLEKYSGCPFAHFMNYGIRPEELEEYHIGAREAGDIYHTCLMKFSQQLEPAPGTDVGDPESPWMSVTDDMCEQMVREIVAHEIGDYMEGTIEAGGLENYKTDRITDICVSAVKSLVGQVQKGSIKSMEFEKPFGRGSDIAPIRVKVGERSILLRGIIDRLDVLDMPGGGQAIRIVDYKTGNDEIKKEYYESGYKLQLMVYMNAVLSGREEAEPAGVFHFHIGELDEADDDGKSSSGDLGERRDKNYRLKGFVLNEENVIRAMDGEFEGESDVIPVKQAKDERYKAAAKGRLFSKDEFKELCVVVDSQVQRICQEIADGAIDVAPRKSGKDQTSCRYCGYRSICLFDTSFDGCRYVKV